MKHSHSCHTPDELEVGEVILIAKTRVGINLQGVVVPVENREEEKIGRMSGYSVKLPGPSTANKCI